MSFVTDRDSTEASTPATSINSSFVDDIVLKGNQLDDNHNSVELEKLVEYILREANEKALELQIKTEEDYEAAKNELVQEMKNNVDSSYKEKYRRVDLKARLNISAERNKSRLKLLEAREKILDEIFRETSDALKHTKRKNAKYHRLLKDLILEAFVQLLEPKARIVVKKGDASWAEKAIPQVITEYLEITGHTTAEQDIELVVDHEEFLSTSAAGGIILYNAQGNIIINNTLEERLKLLEETSLPQIRTIVFGPSNNRAFFN